MTVDIVWVLAIVSAYYFIPGWLILITGILALYGVVTIYFALRPQNTLDAGFKKYTEDIIYEAKWRWVWNNNSIANLLCYCPRCDVQLVYDDSSCRSIYEENRTDYICERCNRQVVSSIIGGNNQYAVGAVKREIERRVRTREHLKNLPT